MPCYLAAVLERLTMELLALSKCRAAVEKRTRVSPSILHDVIAGHSELGALFDGFLRVFKPGCEILLPDAKQLLSYTPDEELRALIRCGDDSDSEMSDNAEVPSPAMLH